LKKPVYLLLAFLLPILIFIFLKFAGKNEFTIPVYYDQEAVKPDPGCDFSYSKPYKLQGWNGIANKDRRDANVLVFPQDDLDISDLSARLKSEMEDEQIVVNDACQLAGDDAICERWRKCVFFAKDPYQTVLFDKEGRIRGYYDLTLREEEDRLRVELKILLKKY
jgi:hypothetical protein